MPLQSLLLCMITPYLQLHQIIHAAKLTHQHEYSYVHLIIPCIMLLMNIPRLAGDREISCKWWCQLPAASKDTGKLGMTEEQNTGTTFNYWKWKCFELCWHGTCIQQGSSATVGNLRTLDRLSTVALMSAESLSLYESIEVSSTLLRTNINCLSNPLKLNTQTGRRWLQHNARLLTHTFP